MNETTPGFNPETKRKLTRDEVKSILALTENHSALEGFNLTNLDLAGEDLFGRSLRGSDARGLSLSSGFNDDGEVEKITHIENSDWTDAIVEAYGPYTNFMAVEAKGSTFGFSKTLYEMRKRDKKTKAENPSLYLGFDGRLGKFQECKWNNIDFQGENQYGAMFYDADLSGSEFEGCDLRGLDWTTTKIDNIKIIIYDPDSLNNLIITTEQIPALISAIQFNDEAYSEGFQEESEKQNPEDVLWNFLGVNAVENKKV